MASRLGRAPGLLVQRCADIGQAIRQTLTLIASFDRYARPKNRFTFNERFWVSFSVMTSEIVDAATAFQADDEGSIPFTTCFIVRLACLSKTMADLPAPRPHLGVGQIRIRRLGEPAVPE
jgi:hypothetical protein